MMDLDEVEAELRKHHAMITTLHAGGECNLQAIRNLLAAAKQDSERITAAIEAQKLLYDALVETNKRLDQLEAHIKT